MPPPFVRASQFAKNTPALAAVRALSLRTPPMTQFTGATVATLSTPGVEPGLSRPQRDVLTTRRCERCKYSHGHIFIWRYEITITNTSVATDSEILGTLTTLKFGCRPCGVWSVLDVEGTLTAFKAVPCRAVPCRAVLRCAALLCAALRCAALRCAVLCNAALCCAMLCNAVLCCAVLCRAVTSVDRLAIGKKYKLESPPVHFKAQATFCVFVCGTTYSKQN